MNRVALIAAANRETWAIDPQWLNSAIANWATFAEVDMKAKLPTVKGDVAIMPLHGPISQRGSIWQEIFGGTSTEQFGAAYARAVNDSRVGAIVLHGDTPGGTTAGVQELADLIHKGSQSKPTYAIANSQLASAGYWIASQVGKGNLYASPGAELGSIGVYRMHEDVSGMLAQEGVKITFIATPQHKTEANPYEPLSQSASDHHLSQVQATYEAFARAVARGRGVPLGVAKSEQFGQGRSYHAEEAVSRGMADRVLTLGDLVRRLTGKAGAVLGQSATAITLEANLCEDLRAAWESGEWCDIPQPRATDDRRSRLNYLTRAR